MSKILFLSHRIPYPPNKGDKIRSFHLLRHLARRNDIYLAAFVDDRNDWQYRAALEAMCVEVKLLGLNPLQRRLLSLAGLVVGEPLSVPYYRHAGLQAWVDRVVLAEGITHAVTFSSPMAQYVCGKRHGPLYRIADFCDVDSDKWHQYAKGRSLPVNWLYRREASRLLEFERRIGAEFDAVLFVSREESDLFKSLAPEIADHVGFFDNGVDTEFFDPDILLPSPFGEGAGPIALFTGAMDYLANIDAVRWFTRTAWPLVRAQAPRAEFWIVGSNPTSRVRLLEQIPGVRVTGRVPDVRPFLAHADVAVAPLRIARGTQNKVLEALAMAKAVACTPAAAAGLCIPTGAAFRVALEPADLARAVLELFRHGPNPAGRESVLARYSWEENLKVVDGLLAGRCAATPERA